MSRLRAAVEGAVPWLTAINEEAAGHKPAPGTWSAKEVLGHLVDSASNNHGRFVRAALQDGLELPGYAQDDWVRLEGWQERRWTDILALWRAYNLHLAHVIERLPADGLSHRVRVGGGEPVTLAWLAEDYVAHLEHHLGQVRERAEVEA